MNVRYVEHDTLHYTVESTVRRAQENAVLRTGRTKLKVYIKLKSMLLKKACTGMKKLWLQKVEFWSCSSTSQSKILSGK